MTVKQLKKLLLQYPDSHSIVLGSDAEGNGFSTLADITEATETGGHAWHLELEFDEEEDDTDSEPNCIVLWPT